MSWKIKIVLLSLFIIPIMLTDNQQSEMKVINEVNNPKLDYHIVKVTMYTTDPKQTDSTPLETASGFILDSLNPKKHRIIAVSHDLKRELKWGQRVKVAGIGKWDGIYVVRDLMNKRFKKRIDILINPGDEATMFKEAKLMLP